MKESRIWGTLNLLTDAISSTNTFLYVIFQGPKGVLNEIWQKLNFLIYNLNPPPFFPCVFPHIYMLHSEILASLNFNKNQNLIPWIGEQPYIKMLLLLFSNINLYIRVVGKMPKQHFMAFFVSNPGDKVLILVESRGQICLIVLLFFGLCPLDWRIMIF